MKYFIVFGSLFVALASLWLVRGAQETDLTVKRNIVYGKGGDSELKLDLAMPKIGNGPFPAIVFLHGGGWSAGKRQDLNPFINSAARNGYVGVTVEYRLAPAAQFPAQVEDCKAAVRWLRANAKTYRIDPAHIAVAGFSAGGHLACMLGVTSKNDGFEGTGGNPEQSSRVQAVVSFFGPTDFSTPEWSKDLENAVFVPFLGGTFTDKPDVYRKASPINYVKKDAPPFLFFHGNRDNLVPLDQSKRLADKLKHLGISAKVVVMEGEGHGFSDPHNQEAMCQTLRFLREQF